MVRGVRKCSRGGVEAALRARAVVLAAIWGVVSAIWVARVVLVPGPIPYSFFVLVLVLGYGGGLYAASNTASRVTRVEAPTIVRRAPGTACRDA
jgi:hypothetical protein